MTRRRRLAASAAILGVLALACSWPLLRLVRGDGSPSTPRADAAGVPGVARETGVAAASSTRPPDEHEQALARAYAAVGAAADGDPRPLAALDARARDRVDEARRMLDDGPPRPTAGGTRADAPSAAFAPTARETGGAPALPATAAASATASEAVTPNAAMTLDLSRAVDPRRALRDTAAGPELLEPGLWAKVPFRPGERPSLVISDRTAGSYAIAIYGGDFSTIRLDGGLVVPGRFYRVHGQAVITGSAAASVDIRPLDAVRGVADQPARIPQGNG